MQAAFINAHGGPEVLSLGELPKPEVLKPNDVVVRIRASSLNHLDLWIRRGLASLKLQFPHILGADGAGTVESCGPEVGHVREGDSVIVHPGLSCGHCFSCKEGVESLCSKYKILGEHTPGTNAEYVVVPEPNVFSMWPGLGFSEAASLPLVFTTAWEMVKKSGLKPTDKVLIHASGSGVSIALIQIARLKGAEIFATSGNTRKLELAGKLGVQHFTDTSRENFVDVVRQETSQKGVDIVFDHVGEAHWEGNIRCLKWGGTLVTCGATSGYRAVVDLRHLFFKQLRLLGSTMGSKRDFPEILKAVQTGKMRPVVDKSFPLGEIRQAHEYLESREALGKVTLEVS